ncbi:MAG TPA: TAXI family TRAP transporter solute-binding subunit [Usitatibacter sp.]|nr:TAXI family TRAP transporter solute-binding subunit [Usitatibacter sp.]
MTLGPFLLLVALAFWFTYRFVRPAPPSTLVMSSGRAGSIFQATAERYRKVLARNGIKLEIVPSEGSLDNLRRLGDPDSKVDVGFVQGGLVQGGLAKQDEADKVASLGSIFYAPVAVFYRAKKPIARLSELAGKSLAIGREGSGTRAIATTLLKANGIEAGGKTTLVDLEGDDAANALVRGSVDAAILTGDSASGANMVRLIHTPGIELFDVTQADAYVRRFPYLSKIELPPGSLDLGRNEPEKPLNLVATTVELVAKPDLHPALSDLLIEAAKQVHGRPSLLQKAGEFPTPLEHEYRLSDDAQRYYQSGKSFWYRHLPFWLASLFDRAVILLIPLALLLPGLKLVPTLYIWRVRQRIYGRYGELMAIEREAFEEPTPERRAELMKHLDDFEARVVRMRMPGWWADELYVLKNHIAFVRRRLEAPAAPKPG